MFTKIILFYSQIILTTFPEKQDHLRSEDHQELQNTTGFLASNPFEYLGRDLSGNQGLGPTHDVVSDRDGQMTWSLPISK